MCLPTHEELSPGITPDHVANGYIDEYINIVQCLTLYITHVRGHFPYIPPPLLLSVLAQRLRKEDIMKFPLHKLTCVSTHIVLKKKKPPNPQCTLKRTSHSCMTNNLRPFSFYTWILTCCSVSHRSHVKRTLSYNDHHMLYGQIMGSPIPATWHPCHVTHVVWRHPPNTLSQGLQWHKRST
jgi:hypothetical protein